MLPPGGVSDSGSHAGSTRSDRSAVPDHGVSADPVDPVVARQSRTRPPSAATTAPSRTSAPSSIAHGNIMVLMTHNTDISDAWEREGEDPRYFYQFSPRGLRGRHQRHVVRDDALRTCESVTLLGSRIRSRGARFEVRGSRCAFPVRSVALLVPLRRDGPGPARVLVVPAGGRVQRAISPSLA